MKVLVTPAPHLSHVWTVVPLAWALQSAGHDVRVATSPNAAEHVTASGLTMLPAGPRLDHALLRYHDDSGPGGFVRTVAQVSGLMAHGLLGLPSELRPDLVLHEPMDMAGPLIAQHFGIPAVQVRNAPPASPRWAAAHDRAASGLRRRLGVAPDIVPPALVVDLCPPSYLATASGLAAPRQAMRFVPYDGPGAVPAWLLERPARPRVCLALGTIQVDEGMRLCERIVSLLCELDLGVEVILPAWPAEAAIPRAAGVRVVDWLPLKLLLASGCSLVIHHGGPKTTLTSLSFGTPQLAVSVHSHPAWKEQQRIGRLLAACGAGLAVDGQEHVAESIAESAPALLTDPRHRRAADSIAAEMAAQPTPAEVVIVLEDLVAGWTAPGHPAPVVSRS
jgi:UDP:flavonoid glycosyltransferase YjiC (YdhE family)